MKFVIKIFILSTTLILIFTKCHKCYPCIEKGDGFDMPYSDSQKVSFISNSSKIIDFTIHKEVQLPPSEYCGPIGSESYLECNGTSSATFKSTNDSLIKMKINYSTDGHYESVELPVFKNVMINSRSLVIMKNKAYTPEVGGNVKVLDTITIKQKLYKNVIEFSRTADSLKENECGYILYGKSQGIIKFSIKRDKNMEEWVAIESKK